MAKTLTRKQASALYGRLAERMPEPETELNYTSPYTLLVAVALSAQATDVGVNKATARLFPVADTPQKMVALGEEKLGEYIKTIGLWRGKAKNVIALSNILIDHYGGETPRDRSALEALPGVGRKTANVVMNVAFGEPTIAVDTHIFRVANRTGLAPGKTPLAVETGLEKITPKEFARHAHHWLILHGRYVCKARRPLCPDCAIADLCLYAEKTKASEPRGEDKFECLSPTPGKAGVRIPRWKYDLVRAAIISALDKSVDGTIAFKELPDAVKAELGEAALRKVGSAMWWTTTVKLDMEARGEIERVAGAKPQRLQRRSRAKRRKGTAA